MKSISFSEHNALKLELNNQCRKQNKYKKNIQEELVKTKIDISERENQKSRINNQIERMNL